MVRFISDSKGLKNLFVSLCEEYDFFEWSIAWAGDIKVSPISLLDKHKKKIKHIVVGLHFYQTSPDFIEHYMHHDGVKFIKQTDGTFHPKVYLFYNKTNRNWAAIIGSSNFTYHGFNKNSEANILVTSEDSDLKVFMDIRSFIKKQWESSSDFNDKELDNYRHCYNKQKTMIKTLSTVVTQGDSMRIETKVFDLKTWDEYAGEVMSHQTYDERIRLLERARILFQQPFDSLPLINRKRLAGCPAPDENESSNVEQTSIDWKFFGSMLGNGVFKQKIIEGDKHIGSAIDSISLSGKIVKQDYEHYIKEFLKAFPNSTNPLASATRLLALKRPDVFICVDGKNKTTLCKQYGILQSHLTIATYWDLLIKRIHQSAWCSYASETEKLYPYRVAMLDCLHYKE